MAGRRTTALVSLSIMSSVMCTGLSLAQNAAASDTTRQESLFISEEDGWVDISGFLDTQFGFLPIAAPISEPAVGYGAAAALTFMGRRTGGRRPDITAIGGFGTANGTWGGFAADSRYWLDEHLQTFGGLLYASMNLDYYGLGKTGELANNPLPGRVTWKIRLAKHIN